MKRHFYSYIQTFFTFIHIKVQCVLNFPAIVCNRTGHSRTKALNGGKLSLRVLIFPIDLQTPGAELPWD